MGSFRRAQIDQDYIYTVYTLPALAKASFSEFVQMIDVSMAKDGKIHPQLESFQESGIWRIGW